MSSSVCTALVSLFPIPPSESRLMMVKKLNGNTARISEWNWQECYYNLYNIMFKTKTENRVSLGKERDCPETGWTLASLWEIVNDGLYISLAFFSIFPSFLLNSLCCHLLISWSLLFLVPLLYPQKCKGSEHTAVGASLQARVNLPLIMCSQAMTASLFPTFVMFPDFNVTSLSKTLLSSAAMLCGQMSVQLLANSPTLTWKVSWVEINSRKQFTKFCHAQNSLDAGRIVLIYSQLKYL